MNITEAGQRIRALIDEGELAAAETMRRVWQYRAEGDHTSASALHSIVRSQRARVRGLAQAYAIIIGGNAELIVRDAQQRAKEITAPRSPHPSLVRE